MDLRFLQVFEGAEEGFLLQNGVNSVETTLPTCSSRVVVSVWAKHPSLRMRSPVLIGLGLDYFIWDHRWLGMFLWVLVVDRYVYTPPEQV